MKIVIIGDGKVGFKLAKQLSEENYDIVLIDPNEGKLKETINRLDIFCITGAVSYTHLDVYKRQLPRRQQEQRSSGFHQ